MALNFFKLIFIVGFLASCASREVAQTSEKVNDSKIVKVVRIQKHLIEKDLDFCAGCVVGSVGDEQLKNSDKETFYLHGAEHLNLQNYYFDIPVVYNAATKKWINYFTGRGKDLYRRYAERAGRYAPVLSKILNEQGLPRDLIFLSMAESGFANHARSWAKAVGPWQFMPYTGRRFGLEVGFFLDERRDPLKATVAAGEYLKKLHELFGSWELAMAGYNAGEGKIGRAIRRYRTKNFWKIRRGRYLKAETKNYVPKIMALAIIGKNLKTFGFEPIEFKKPLDFQEIEVPGNTDLYKVAEVVGSDFDEMKKYNPEILRWQTPPKMENYILRVPVGKKDAWEALEDKSIVKATDYKIYQLRGYASLYHVGRKFKVPSKVLAQINDMNPKKRLFPKTAVFLPFRENHRPRKNHLYADLYEKPRKSVVRRRNYNRWIKRGRARGEHIEKPKQFYIVKKGDTLWGIASKTGVNINTIIRSNYSLVKKRMILPGDKLAIK
ncbi:MAG: transglycosylase SLT domain-containing protein [Bacteriovoracaceae bacterium]